MLGCLATSVFEVGLQPAKDHVAIAMRTMAATGVLLRRGLRLHRVISLNPFKKGTVPFFLFWFSGFDAARERSTEHHAYYK